MATQDQPVMHARPLSPHLSIYKPMPTMVMSILHRITGAALYFGTLLLAFWLVAAASGPQAFSLASWVFDSWIGRIILLGYTWALFQHMLGGIRHFIWDTGAGLEKNTATKIAIASAIGAVVLTAVSWYFVAVLGMK
jgi:succinate dehydrogenase / fumarate reductase, cytochrome b subunit